MKLGVILEHSDPRRGGAERYAHELAGRLRLHGHDVAMASRTGPAARPVRSRPAALRPRYFAETFLPALRSEGAEVVLTLAPVPKCEFFLPPTGFLQASIPPHYEPVPQPWRAIRRANPIRRLHLRVLRRFEAAALAPPSILLAQSPRIVADAERLYPGVEPRLVRVGVDLARYRPAEPGERRPDGLPSGPLLLFVAHNFELKGLGTCLRSLGELEGVHLAVVGDGERSRFGRIADRLGVASRVHWRGTDPELARLYRTSDLLVHPTFYDAAGLVLLEALSSGTAAITTPRAGNADLVARGGALLDDPADHRGLARLVTELLATDRDARARRARAVAEEFPADALLDRVVEILTS